MEYNDDDTSPDTIDAARDKIAQLRADLDIAREMQIRYTNAHAEIQAELITAQDQIKTLRADLDIAREMQIRYTNAHAEIQAELMALHRRRHARCVIAIPPGVAHGFYTEYGCILTYLLTEEYDGSDEYGFDPWDDSFPGRWYWPERDQVKVSERDLNAPPLKTFLAGL